MRKLGTTLALIVALALAACGGRTPTSPQPPVDPNDPPPPPPPPPPTLSVTTFLAFGDSITAGTESAPLPMLALDAGIAVSYPFKLQDLLRERYSDQTINVYNAGKPGEKAADGAARFEGVVDDANPDVVFLMEGANDLNSLNANTMTELEMETRITTAVNYMENMVRRALREHVKVYVATLPPEREDSPKGKHGAPWVERYNSELKAMAKKKGAKVVDLGSKFPLELIGEDGLHPTDAGYDQMAEIFFETIKKAFELPPSPSSQALKHSASLPVGMAVRKPPS